MLVAGSLLSAVEIAKIYGQVYGVEPKLVDRGSFAEAKEQLAQLKKDQPNPYAWMGLNYQIIVWNGQNELDNADNARFSNIKFTTIQDYFQRVKKEKLATEMGEL